MEFVRVPWGFFSAIYILYLVCTRSISEGVSCSRFTRQNGHINYEFSTTEISNVLRRVQVKTRLVEPSRALRAKHQRSRSLADRADVVLKAGVHVVEEIDHVRRFHVREVVVLHFTPFRNPSHAPSSCCRCCPPIAAHPPDCTAKWGSAVGSSPTTPHSAPLPPPLHRQASSRSSSAV